MNYIEREGGETTENVQSWAECSDLCSARADCTAWTWNKKNSHKSRCITMTGFGTKIYDDIRVSGSRECKGKKI